MVFFETIAVAFSMYSALPMPMVAWKPENLRYAMCAFPLIGIVLGGLCALWAWLCQRLALPVIIQGAGLTLLPVLVTGGIHLDGYADTWDARSSHASPERRAEILKDPHIGTFAVIRLCVLFVIRFALWCSMPKYDPVAVTAVFCLSRTLSGLSVAAFPLAKNTGLVHTFATSAHRANVRRVLLALAVLLTMVLAFRGLSGVVCAAAGWAVFGRYYRLTVAEFGGLSGDLAGWFLETGETWMLLALCLCPLLF